MTATGRWARGWRLAVLCAVVGATLSCAGVRGKPPGPAAPAGVDASPPPTASADTQAGRSTILDALETTFDAHLVEATGVAGHAVERLRVAREILLGQPSATAFFDQLNQVLQGSGIAHLYVYQRGRDLFDNDIEDSWLVGATLIRTDGFTFVTDVWEGGPAAEAGLLYGDELLPVDGNEAVLDPLPAGVHKVRLWVRRERQSQPFFLDIEAAEGGTAWYLAESTRSSIRRVEHRGCTVGVIHLRTFADETLIDELVTGAHFDGTEGLIIDLRGNRGGEVRLAGEVLDLLSRQPSIWIHYHNNRYSFPPTSWNRPLVILVDGETYSAAEIFAAAAQVRELATVVGTATSGRVQASRLFPLPDGSRLLLPISRVTLPDCGNLEGRGVLPDHTVERPVRYAASADPPMDRAFELLEQQLACPEELPPERFPQEVVAPRGRE